MALTHRDFKDALYEQLARIGKAASAPKRLELLELLAQGPRTVESLAGEAAISMANASQHLQALRIARLVEAEKKGLHVEYRIASDEVCAFFVALRTLATARLAEVEQVSRAYLQDRGALEPISGEELLRRAANGDVIVLDVRPASEYRAGHLPGALSIPLAELGARLRELPKKREIVAYCRGPYCVFALEAVAALRRRGIKAVRAEDGVSEWRLAGLPVEGTATGGP